MSYRVVWRARTAARLHQFAFVAYETGADGGAIVDAQDIINERLATNPQTEGESRDDSERVLIVHPLTVVYEVFEEARVVLIYAAVYYPRMRA